MKDRKMLLNISVVIFIIILIISSCVSVYFKTNTLSNILGISKFEAFMLLDMIGG
ncbi:MAG: hypothetical protein ACRC1T_09395 [Clostridium chrysemydis]|uniref:hypothetical protein n=1 Tax=Clostridium chrysemydis TaxID=2665504 RepID=UPI003F30D081